MPWDQVALYALSLSLEHCFPIPVLPTCEINKCIGGDDLSGD